MVCWFIAFYRFWQCLTWCSTFKFVCYTVFISFEFPFSYKLYICFIYLFFSCIIAFEFPFTIIFFIYVFCFCWLRCIYFCLICITILVCWFVAFYRFWQCFTLCSTFESVCYTVFVSFEFPFSYKLYICLIYCFIFSIVALEYPFSIVFCIYVLCFCRLSCTYIIFVYITIWVCWFVAFYRFWQCFTLCSAFEFVGYSIFIRCKLPCSYKLYICFIYCFSICIIFFKYPFPIIFFIYVFCFCWLCWCYISFIFVSSCIFWLVVFDYCW